jgi:hypothetical protein
MVMQPPPLVHYSSEEDYRNHFVKKYCNRPVITFDGIPVYFNKNRFDDCMFESSNRHLRNKDIFSFQRAERIDWIEETLRNPNNDLYQGWNRDKKIIDPHKRVAVAFNDYAVIIRIKKTKAGKLKAEFITAYVADNSINMIRSNPRWT